MQPDPVRDIRLQKPAGRALEKRERLQAKLKAWIALVRYVKVRDGHTCRVCGKAGGTLDPHHIVFRSAGGKDTKDNVCLAHRWCHDEIHAGRIFVSGSAEGKLRIERA